MDATNLLTTFAPIGARLAFNMLQSGHDYDRANDDRIAADHSRTPVKPYLDAQPAWHTVERLRPIAGGPLCPCHSSALTVTIGQLAFRTTLCSVGPSECSATVSRWCPLSRPTTYHAPDDRGNLATHHLASMSQRVMAVNRTFEASGLCDPGGPFGSARSRSHRPPSPGLSGPARRSDTNAAVFLPADGAAVVEGRAAAGYNRGVRAGGRGGISERGGGRDVGDRGIPVSDRARPRGRRGGGDRAGPAVRADGPTRGAGPAGRPEARPGCSTRWTSASRSWPASSSAPRSGSTS